MSTSLAVPDTKTPRRSLASDAAGPASPLGGASADRNRSGGGGLGATMSATAVDVTAALNPVAQDPQSAIVASTFANLELATTKKTLSQFTALYEKAKEENARLAQELKDRDRDALQVVEFLRYDIEEKKTQLRESEQKLATMTEQLESAHSGEIEKWVVTVAEKDQLIDDCKQEIEKLKKDIDSVALFKREKQELHLEVAKQQEVHAATINRYEKELTKLRFQSLEDKVQLRAAEQDMVKHFNEEVDTRAMLLVDTKARKIHQENQALQKDQQALTEEVERVTALNQDYLQATQMVQREAELGRAMQREYAKQGTKLTATANEAQAKSKHLELRLQEATDHFSREIAWQQEQASSREATLTDQLKRSQQNEKLLRSELVKMREYARQIVDGRSELETFFYETLEYVREQQGAPTSARGRQGGGNSVGKRSGSVPALPASLRKSLDRQRGQILHSAGSTASAGSTGMMAPPPPPAKTAAGVREPQTARGTRPLPSLRHGSGSSATARRSQVDEKLLASSARSRPESHHRFFVTELPAQQDQGQLVPVPDEEKQEEVRPQQQRTAPAEVPDFAPTPPLPKATGAKAGADFSELDWKAKETVIRALLFKINQSFYASAQQRSRQQQQQYHQQQADQMLYEQQQQPHHHVGMGDGFEDCEPVLGGGEDEFEGALPPPEATSSAEQHAGHGRINSGQSTRSDAAEGRPSTRGTTVAMMGRTSGGGKQPPSSAGGSKPIGPGLPLPRGGSGGPAVAPMPPRSGIGSAGGMGQNFGPREGSATSTTTTTGGSARRRPPPPAVPLHPNSVGHQQ